MLLDSNSNNNQLPNLNELPGMVQHARELCVNGYRVESMDKYQVCMGMIEEVRAQVRDSATRNCLNQMYDNLHHEFAEIQDIHASYEVFKYPPTQLVGNNGSNKSRNPRLGNLNPNFGGRANGSEKENQNYPNNNPNSSQNNNHHNENIYNQQDQDYNYNEGEMSKPTHINPHKLLSKEEKLALRKNVNNHYNQYIGDIGNPHVMGNKGLNFDEVNNVNNNFVNNLRGGDDRGNNSNNGNNNDKDPLEWSPAPKKKEYNLQRRSVNNNMNNNGGNNGNNNNVNSNQGNNSNSHANLNNNKARKKWGNENNNNNHSNQNQSNQNQSKNPQSNQNINNVGRNYDRPWMKGVEKKEEKSQPTTFLEFCSQNGRPVDEHLINTLECEVVDSNLNVTFDDIAGNEEAKSSIEEACIYPIMYPELFDTSLRKPWKGILLFGPPGTGKTMLAKAVASSCNSKFFKITASSLGSKWRGESEKLVRLLFEMARFYAPSIIFIDEIDSLAVSRGDDTNDCSRRVLTELLNSVDGLVKGDDEEQNKQVLFLAATNHPWHLDTAMIRRLEKRIYIPLPDEAGREQMIRRHLSKEVVSDDIQYTELVKSTKGYSGSDMTQVLKNAAYMPLREMFDMLKKEGKNPKDYVNNEEMKKIRHDHIIKSIKTTKKTVQEEDILKYDNWFKKQGSL